MTLMTLCPICGATADEGRSRDYGERFQISCPRCGNYELTRTAEVMLAARLSANPRLAMLLSHRVRMLHSAENPWPSLNSLSLKSLTSDEEYPSLEQQLDNLLRFLEASEQFSLQKTFIDSSVLPSITGSAEEGIARMILEQLKKEGLVDALAQADGFLIGLTFEGKSKLERLDMAKDKAVSALHSPPEKLKVFLCHSKGDKEKVRELYNDLSMSKTSPWFDEEDLVPGQEWEAEIHKAVNEAHVCLVCLSKESTGKEGYVQKEIRIALDAALKKPDNTIYIVPVRLEECDLPDKISKYHCVDLFTLSGFAKLLRALQIRAAQLNIPTAIELPS